jgi:phospholipid transport system substrate-binding protein
VLKEDLVGDAFFTWRAIFVWMSLMAALTSLAPRGATAGPLSDQVRESIDTVLKIVSDPELKKDARTADRRRMIRQVAGELFDFTEISQRSLGPHWRARTPAEREQFIGLFGDLLEYSYVSKIETYSGETIRYLGEAVDGQQAVVKTRIVTKQGTEIPVDYRMMQNGNRWLVYDVNIEGVSLVSNYRSQFNAVIQRSGYPDLVAKLKAKQVERPGPPRATP